MEFAPHKPTASSQLIAWERRWLPLGVEGEDREFGTGFLESWDDVFGLTSKNGLKTLPELLDLRCLVLCGEPGMGKSKELELQRTVIEGKARQKGALYWRSFRDTISPEHLLADLTASEPWRRWLDGSELTVVTDGVDEGLALASNLIRVLTAELRGRPVERLHLILVCRDAEWPLKEGTELMSLWEPEDVGRFKLQRLRVCDAEEAARHWGLSEQKTAEFMAAIRKAAIEEFAARPITLQMLVEEFKLNHGLPGTRIQVFERGCLRLCRQDPDRAKFLKKAVGFQFTERQLFSPVTKAAALTLLCRYSGISETPSQHRLDFESLIPKDANAEERAKIEVALGTALFADAGHQSRCFAHPSYADYLAAVYLSGFPLAQIFDLICIRSGEGRHVVPQLSEVAAWLALKHEDFANWLIVHEPEILLRNDASSLSQKTRERFVSELFKRLQKEEAFDDWQLKRFYASFYHPKLAEQLRPYLKDPKTSRFAMRAAIHLAQINRLNELFEELFDIAKDRSVENGLREQAMNAVCDLIHDTRLAELEPFARCEAGPDPHDELRAAALKTMIPRHWKVSTALPALGKGSNLNFIGEFHMVCAAFLPKELETTDVVAVLKHFAQMDYPFQGMHNNLENLAYRTLVVAGCNLDKPDIAGEFLSFIRKKLSQHQLPLGIDNPEWKESIADNPTRRRKLAEVLVAAPGITAEELRDFQFHRFVPLKIEDCSWFIKQVESANDAMRALWVKLVRMFWPNVMDSPSRDEFMEACERVPELGADINWPCAVDINSEAGKACREAWEYEKRVQKAPGEVPPQPAAEERFNAALLMAETDWRHWGTLGWELQRAEDGADIYSANLDATQKHRWRVCTETQKRQVVQCARAFLLKAEVSDVLKGKDPTPIEVIWALWLTKDYLDSDKDLLFAFKEKWSIAVLARPYVGGAQEQQILAKILVDLDVARAKEALRHALLTSLTSKVGVANVLASFELAWQSAFSQVLADFATRNKLAGAALISVMSFLARQDAAVVSPWLDDQLNAPTQNDLPTLLALAAGLTSDTTWQAAKAQLEKDPVLATSSLQKLADMHVSSKDMLSVAGPVRLADLFLLLENAFPTASPIKAPPDDARQHVEKLRNSIPERLEAMANQAACDELVRLASAIPQSRTWLRWHLRDARQNWLRNSWSGVPLEVVLAMGEKHERRWVRSEEDLQELVLDSVARFQDELNHTVHPTVPDLWNEKPPRPKDEIALTEKLVRWLNTDLGAKNGAAVGCQVEPSRVHETDIEVWARQGSAAPAGEGFVITIEVKCSFNREVATSLEKQLIGEYLLTLNRKYGIYLVGWYKAPGWKPDHNPLKAKNYAQAKQVVSQLLSTSRSAYPELRVDAVCLNCEFPQAFRRRAECSI
jgi:hypothetical protein